MEKVVTIRDTGLPRLRVRHPSWSPLSLKPPLANGSLPPSLNPLSEGKAPKSVTCSSPTTCVLDLILTSFLQAISQTNVPAVVHVIIVSLTSGTFSSAFKQAWVRCLLKKLSLNLLLVENFILDCYFFSYLRPSKGYFSKRYQNFSCSHSCFKSSRSTEKLGTTALRLSPQSLSAWIYQQSV